MAVSVSEITNLWCVIDAGASSFLSSAAKRNMRIYKGFRPNKAFAASVTLTDWGWSDEFAVPAHGDRYRRGDRDAGVVGGGRGRGRVR